jgi:lipopolysaccharide transport system permease protein
MSLLKQEVPYTLIQPSKGWVSLNLKELWQYRELVYFLIWRDIKIRYKQTILGASWAIIQPFMTMVVFSLFFGNLASIPSNGVPYPIFSYAALVPWAFFANSLQMSATSLVRGANLIKKVYFPRLAVPIGAVMSGLIDFLLAFMVLLGMMLAYGITPDIRLIWLPIFLLLTLVTALGVGLWLSALNAQFRDMQYVVPFLTQFWLFITPIAYPSNLIEDQWLRNIYGINPMTSVVEGFRWTLLGTQTAPTVVTGISMIAAVLLFASGLFYFRRLEKTLVDIL